MPTRVMAESSTTPIAVLGRLSLAAVAATLLFAATASAQIDVSNSTVTCNSILKGSMKISPALATGGVLPTVFKVQGKLAGCTTDAVGVTLVDGKSSFKGEITLPTNDCGVLAGPNTATGTLTFKWKATESISPNKSVVTINSGSLQSGVYAAPWGGMYGAFGLGVSTFPTGGAGTALGVTGAFTGGDAGATSAAALITTQDLASTIASCTGGGLKVLDIGAGQITLD